LRNVNKSFVVTFAEEFYVLFRASQVTPQNMGRSSALDLTVRYFQVSELLWFQTAMNSVLAGNLFCMLLIRLVATLFISFIFHIVDLQLWTKLLKQTGAFA
jgi:hypothetical protein